MTARGATGGRAGVPGRGPRRAPLSLPRIAAAALALVDEEGLDGFSMRRLGRRLGVEAMSLYAHAAGKDEILDEVVDLVFQEMELPAGGRPWDEVLHDLYADLRRVLLAHPNTVPLLATHTAHSLEAIRPLEVSLRTLREAGFAEQDAVDGHRVLMSFTIGYLIGEVSRMRDPDVDPNSWGTASYALLDLPAEQVPHLVALAPIALDRSVEDQFAVLLRLILNGIGATFPLPDPNRTQ